MWLFESLFFAFWGAISLYLIKRLTFKVSSSIILLLTLLFTLPWMVVLILLTGGFPGVNNLFYLLMAAAAILDIIALTAYFSAIKLSAISLIGPILSFTPVFTTIFALGALREVPTGLKLAGIITIVTGAYLFNLKDIKKGLFAPLVNLFTNKGVALTLLATLLWALTPIFQKEAIFQTTPRVPLFASFIGMVFVASYLLIVHGPKLSNHTLLIKKNLFLLIGFGLGAALAQLAAYTAFSSAKLGYVTAVMRTSSLFTVIIGGLFLKEKEIAQRFLGAGIMLVGIVLLAI